MYVYVLCVYVIVCVCMYVRTYVQNMKLKIIRLKVITF
jgi:hypothetical protein